MPYTLGGSERHSSAFAVGPEGALRTRYDQWLVDRPRLFALGESSRAWWFRVKSVPAVVTIGCDALLSEIAEVAAVGGALLHIHLAHDRHVSQLRRKQLWVNLASFRALTATVNAATPGGGSTIWQDCGRASPRPAGGCLPQCAVRLAEAGPGEEVVCAAQAVPRANPHDTFQAQRMNSQTAA